MLSVPTAALIILKIGQNRNDVASSRVKGVVALGGRP